MSFWEGFNKYFGIQGVIAVLLILAYILAIFLTVSLPAGFEAIMLIVIGFFFGKNGNAYVQKAKDVASIS